MVNADRQVLEQKIGPAPAEDTVENRRLIRLWCLSLGIPQHRIDNMQTVTLLKMYNLPKYRQKVIRAVVRHAGPLAPDASAPVPQGLNREEVEHIVREIVSEREADIEKLIAKYVGPRPPVEHIVKNDTKTKKLPKGLYHKQFKQVLTAVQCGNVFLRGPAGSGKTTVASQVSEALDVDFYFTGAVASEHKLIGYRNPEGKLIRTAFRDAYEKGGLFLFDEIDASAPQALLSFNAALSNDHMDFPDGTVKMHKDFRCIAAGNTVLTGADRVYVGRNQLDGATIDRFIFIDFNYDEDLERNAAGNDKWVLRVQMIRKAVESLKLRHIVSPRASIMGAKLLAREVAQEEVERLVLWRGLDGPTVNKILANVEMPHD